MTRSVLLLALCALLPACGSSDAPDDAGAAGAGGSGEPDYPDSLPYARSVERFEPGADAGFNQDKLPDVVLGPPRGKGTQGGSLDVVSLGLGGELVLGFGDRAIVDQPGPDLIVFENPFWPGGDASLVYAELAEVSVSEDGETWLTFPCDAAGDGAGNFPGCAGWTPTLAYDPLEILPLDPAQTGGDAFDLAELELPSARFVRIRDLATLEATGTTSGFDLDAVGLVGPE